MYTLTTQTLSPFQSAPGASSPRVKWPGGDSDHSPPSAEITTSSHPPPPPLLQLRFSPHLSLLRLLRLVFSSYPSFSPPRSLSSPPTLFLLPSSSSFLLLPSSLSSFFSSFSSPYPYPSPPPSTALQSNADIPLLNALLCFLISLSNL